MRELVAAIAALVTITSTAYGQSELGDISQGHQIARTECAECHRVEKDQRSRELSLAVPFQKIADNPIWTALSLRVFLRTPHKNMPNFILPEAETDNVIAYILSLK
jgi:mono/diheme cytochrome c family protein